MPDEATRSPSAHVVQATHAVVGSASWSQLPTAQPPVPQATSEVGAPGEMMFSPSAHVVQAIQGVAGLASWSQVPAPHAIPSAEPPAQ